MDFWYFNFFDNGWLIFVFSFYICQMLVYWFFIFWGFGQVGFIGNYIEYFGLEIDVDVVIYLMLVNDMIYGFYFEVVIVGEDVSFLNILIIIIVLVNL